jgi:hypothetical protein
MADGCEVLIRGTTNWFSNTNCVLLAELRDSRKRLRAVLFSHG